MSFVGSFFSYVNDARSHEPEERLTIWANFTCGKIRMYFGITVCVPVLGLINSCVAEFDRNLLIKWGGARGGADGCGTTLQAGRSRFRFPMVSLEFLIDLVVSAAVWPWGRLSLYQK